MYLLLRGFLKYQAKKPDLYASILLRYPVMAQHFFMKFPTDTETV